MLILINMLNFELDGLLKRMVAEFTEPHMLAQEKKIMKSHYMGFECFKISMRTVAHNVL